MWRALLLRLLWVPPTLLAISAVAYLLIEAAPVDRALLEVERDLAGRPAAERDALLRARRIEYGLIDATTGEELGLATRYGRWLGRALTLRFEGEGDDPAAFRDRIARALPVTLLVGTLALLLALAVALPLGAWLGMRRGRRREEVISALGLGLHALPEFLVATWLLLGLAGGTLVTWFPTGGVRSAGADGWSGPAQVLDLVHHLALPVATLALAPAVTLTRYLRDSVARAAASEFALSLRALGASPRRVRRSVLRAGLSPVLTQLGVLVPALLGGSLVVEQVFTLPGIGRLAVESALSLEREMVLAVTLLTSVVTLLALILSDVLHALVDPRVVLR